MTQYSVDLPFLMSLNEDDYPLRLGDLELSIRHQFVQRDRFDPRIGSIESGSFGLDQGDPLGAVRYSRLFLDVDDDDLDFAGTTLSGRISNFPDMRDVPRGARKRAEVALGVFNRFLDKYRTATRRVDIKPIVPPWNLALLKFDDGRNSREIRLYGRGLTLPIAGLSKENQQKVLDELAEPEPNATFELAAVDAMRAVEDGETLEAVVTSIGALEAALDMYFSRAWRMAQPRVFPTEGLTRLGYKASRAPKVYTIEDVLEICGVRAKVDAYATATGKPKDLKDLYSAIELRNLAVHGGVRVPVGKARRHVERAATFVLDEVAPRIQSEFPSLPSEELLYACEEALGSLGSHCSPELERVVASYVTGRGLATKLYHQRHNRHEMSTERFGNTVLIRISFEDFSPDQINLFIAQALLHHYLERRGDVAVARPPDDPAMADRRPFFEIVAAEMTRTVWGRAINKRLSELGFSAFVEREAQRRAAKLRKLYGRKYVAPRFEELGSWVDYLALSQVAADLPEADREALLEVVARVAQDTARRAVAAVRAMETVEFDDLESIRRALIQVHDAHERMMGDVSIFDPITQQRYGFGLKLEDFGIFSIGPIR